MSLDGSARRAVVSRDARLMRFNSNTNHYRQPISRFGQCSKCDGQWNVYRIGYWLDRPYIADFFALNCCREQYGTDCPSAQLHRLATYAQIAAAVDAIALLNCNREICHE